MTDADTREGESTTTKKTETKGSGEWRSMMIDLGMHMLTGFLSGLTLAAGTHCYQVLIKGKHPGNEDSNVVPLRRQG